MPLITARRWGSTNKAQSTTISKKGTMDERRTMQNMNSNNTISFCAEIGSVSHGTMKEEDLIPRFIEILDELKEAESLSDTPNKERFTRLDDKLGDLERCIQVKGYFESEDARCYDLEWLFNALDEYSPPFCFFGAHEGDGADYGFWVSRNAIEEAVQDYNIIEVDAGDVWNSADTTADYVLEVTDHDNMTLFDRATRKELWAIA